MRAGDHVRVLREGRWDHAIDCGDRTVIHFVGGPGAAIRHSPLADFARIGERVEVVPHLERVHPPREVVARAYSRMGDPAFAHMFGGAEQFAVWCKSGLLPPPSGAAPWPLPAEAAPARVRAPAARRKKARSERRAAGAKASPGGGKARRTSRPARKAPRAGKRRR